MRQTYAQLLTRVQQNVGINAASYDLKIKNWLNEVYEDVYDTFFWPGSLVRGTVSTVASQEYVNFPSGVRQVLFLSQTTTPDWLRFSDSADFVRSFFATITTTGTPTNWADDGKSTVLNQPSSASVLSLASDSASDTSQTVRVQGRDANGTLLSESMSINGTTAVLSVNTYTTIESIVKSAASTGIFTLTSNAAAVTVTRIAPTETASAFVKARLNYVPNAAITLYYIGKRQIVRLTNDEDQPLIDMDSAIVAGATTLALREQGDAKSEIWADRTGTLITKRRDEILGQGMSTLRLKPDYSGRPRSNFYGSWR